MEAWVDVSSAVQNPFDYGYEGRIGVDRESSDRRKYIAPVLRQFAVRNLLAPEKAQYEYLLCYGYYTGHELRTHPARPKATLAQEENAKTEEAAEMKEHMYCVEENEDAKWKKREARIKRWGRKRAENSQRILVNSQQLDLTPDDDDQYSDNYSEPRTEQSHSDGLNQEAPAFGAGRGRGQGGRGGYGGRGGRGNGGGW